MSAAIEDYALISDARTGALVSRDGSIDWFCPPRFDAPSVFGALLGDEDHGHWRLGPVGGGEAQRQYESEDFTLVTRWTTDTGVVEVTDLMPIDGPHTHIIRRVRGISGSVPMATTVRFRFDYAAALPWVRQHRDAGPAAIAAIAGPDAMLLRGVALTAEDNSHVGGFTIAEGEVRDLVLTWYPSFEPHPEMPEVDALLRRTRTWWQRWSTDLHREGPYRDEVKRSLLVLRALTHRDTGGIVAAATTSLPEQFGGTRNWDYRYVWLRDASLTLMSLIRHHHLTAARHWRSWLLRAIAGDPADVQIMYGIAGERYLPERELSTLPGYQGSGPVRVGNGAVDQFQADVIGEVIVALDDARRAGLAEEGSSWSLQRALIGRVVETVDRPDQGLWEIRGEPHRFTHSRAMIWAALDRGVRAVREFGLDGDLEIWERLRDEVRIDIDTRGVSADGHFTQYFGTDEVDASLLVLPQIGFCTPDDPRMLATVARIERDLMRDGLLMRYRAATGVDGIDEPENPFLACSFWLVEQYARTGRRDDAVELMDRLCALTNDLGLLSEEYDVGAGRQAGNVPQAFSHLALVRAADALAEDGIA